MFICKSEDDHDICNATHITPEFAKWFLIYKKLLVDDPGATKFIFSKRAEQEESRF